MIGILVTAFLASILLIAWDYYVSTKEITNGLKRKGYGEGAYTESLKVRGESGETANIEVEISEKQYTKEEMKKVFDRCILKLEKSILGENQSYDMVDKDMNLVTELPGEQVDISWELDRYDVMDIHGKLKSEGLKEEGVLVNLSATLTYREETEFLSTYECTIMVYPNREEQGTLAAKVSRLVEEKNQRTKIKEYLPLPEKVDGDSVTYFTTMDTRGIVLMTMVILISVLLYALEVQNRDQREKERKQQMLVDYPEIINKLTLYLGAGMIVRRAWRKIVEDYGERKKAWGIRYAYEEMEQTYREMESGISEAESYERFGKRCNIQEYMKLGALLAQNLRKGTRGLREILRMEATQALAERKARAKRMGEEAGTKMLAPMFLMLAVVLVIVIVPAFLSIQL